jgi:hypothetical protein
MTSYLIFAIDYCHIFKDLLRERSAEFKMEPVFVWYPTLWRHKAQYNFYPGHKKFISEIKKLIYGLDTSIMSLDVASFVSEKIIFETTEDFIILILFGFQKKPFFSPSMYVINTLLLKYVDNTSIGNTFLMKIKEAIIPFPQRFGEVVVNHIYHLDEFVGNFDQLGLK